MQNAAKTTTINLVANQPFVVNMTGTYLRCLSGDTFDVEIGTRTEMFGGEFPLSAGKSVTTRTEFETVRATSPTNQTITLFSFNGDYRDDTLIVPEFVSVNTKPLGYDMETKAAVSALSSACTLLIAANPLRRYVGLYNEGVEDIYVRENSTASKSPFVLAPGAFLPVPLTSDVYAYNPGANACTILIAEFV